MTHWRWMEREEQTNVRALCEAYCRHAAALCMKHGVRWTLDIDADLEFELSSTRIRDLLQTLLESALQRMPEGGHLYWTAVVTRRGLELEIADTSEVERPILMKTMGAGRTAVQVESYLCPQGGVAQTLIVPWSTSMNLERRDWRRAA